MDRVFRCPACGVRTWVAARMVGRRGPCFRCGAEVEISEANLESVVEAKAEPSAAARESWRPEEIWESSAAWGFAWRRWAMGGAVFLLAIAIVLAFSRWGIPAIKSGGERAEMGRRLRRVASAMMAYHELHGSFPPAVTYAADGRPMHSWRALLIPHLDEAGLMAGYDFSQPWDSPTNAPMQAVRFPDFLPPDSEIGAGLHETAFMVVVGKGTAFRDRSGVSRDSLAGDLGEIVLVVEVTSSGHHWLEPADLDWETANLQIGGGKGAPGNTAGSGAWVATADGEVEWLGKQVTAEQLMERLRCDGDE